MKKTTCLALGFALLSQSSFAKEIQPTEQKTTSTSEIIKTNFEKSTKTLSFSYVEPFQNTGLHAVQHNGSYMLVSEDLSILLSGNAINLKDKTDIKKQWVKKSITPILNNLPEENYTTYPAKNEKIDTLWVLSDLSCAYCQSFHEQIPQLTVQGIEVRIIPFVRGLNSNVSKKNYDNTIAIYSTRDQAKRRELQERAFSGDYIGKTEKINNKAKAILEKGFDVGLSASISGTPMLINSNGNTLEGLADIKFIVENFIPLK